VPARFNVHLLVLQDVYEESEESDEGGEWKDDEDVNWEVVKKRELTSSCQTNITVYLSWC
jgi:hypothetical protein